VVDENARTYQSEKQQGSGVGPFVEAGLPGVPVAAPEKLDDVCVPRPIPFSAGRVVTLARADRAAFVAVVLPGSAVKMGRNHLWRLRDDVASSLPTDIRELLTRRRSGDFDLGTTR
jgi:hypothetical protein